MLPIIICKSLEASTACSPHQQTSHLQVFPLEKRDVVLLNNNSSIINMEIHSHVTVASAGGNPTSRCRSTIYSNEMELKAKPDSREVHAVGTVKEGCSCHSITFAGSRSPEETRPGPTERSYGAEKQSCSAVRRL